MLEILNDKNNAVEEEILLVSMLSLKGQDYEIKPILDNGKIVYNIEGKKLEPYYLQELEKKGVLERKSNVSFPACPVCRDLNLSIRLVCPMCKSISLIKSEFLIHYECGYIGPFHEFIRENMYVCPRCKKTMKTVGIDYGRPGISFRCNECFNIFQFPIVLIKCNKNHEFKVDDVEIISYPIYKLGKNITYYSKLSRILYNTILKLNFEKNLTGIIFSYVIGISGSKHFFPLIIKKDEELIAAVEIVLYASELNDIILRTIVKSLDINSKILLITIKGQPDLKFASILNPDRIKIINVDSEEEISQKILENI